MRQNLARPYGPMIDADPNVPSQPPASWHFSDMLDTKTVVIAVLLGWLAYDKVPSVRAAVSKVRAKVR